MIRSQTEKAHSATCLSQVRLGNRPSLCLLLLVSVLACTSPTGTLHPDQPVLSGVEGPEEKVRKVYVVSHGWHTGIVLKREDIPEAVWPEVRDFAGTDYLEVGWGDWVYYQSPEPTWGMALKAVFWSTRSVLHVAGFNGPVEKYFFASEIVEIALSERAFRELCQFVSRTHLRVGPGESMETGPGLYAKSRFYAAQGKFHIFRNCNTWVAEALRAAGLPVKPSYAMTAGAVMAQISRIATPVLPNP